MINMMDYSDIDDTGGTNQRERGNLASPQPQDNQSRLRKKKREYFILGQEVVVKNKFKDGISNDFKQFDYYIVYEIIDLRLTEKLSNVEKIVAIFDRERHSQLLILSSPEGDVITHTSNRKIMSRKILGNILTSRKSMERKYEDISD